MHGGRTTCNEGLQAGIEPAAAAAGTLPFYVRRMSYLLNDWAPPLQTSLYLMQCVIGLLLQQSWQFSEPSCHQNAPMWGHTKRLWWVSNTLVSVPLKGYWCHHFFQHYPAVQPWFFLLHYSDWYFSVALSLSSFLTSSLTFEAQVYLCYSHLSHRGDQHSVTIQLAGPVITVRTGLNTHTAYSFIFALPGLTSVLKFTFEFLCCCQKSSLRKSIGDEFLLDALYAQHKQLLE